MQIKLSAKPSIFWAIMLQVLETTWNFQSSEEKKWAS